MSVLNPQINAVIENIEDEQVRLRIYAFALLMQLEEQSKIEQAIAELEKMVKS